MNRFIVEDGLEENSRKQRRKRHLWQRIFAFSILFLSILALGSFPVLAWLYGKKSVQTVTMVSKPNALMLGAGNVRAMQELVLGEVDVTAEPSYKDVVFCVYSDGTVSYSLQLAHTTNIGFAYELFPAALGEGGGSSKVDYLQDSFSFDSQKPLAGGYLNLAEDSSGNSPLRAKTTGDYHNKTYEVDGNAGVSGSYEKVQKYAEPLYWKASSSLELKNEDLQNGNYIHYYVLRISWGDRVTNNKETDMVYLMAEVQ